MSDSKNYESIDLIQITRTVFQYKNLIRNIILTILTITVLYSLLAPKTYKVSYTFFIPTAQQGKSGAGLFQYAKILGVDIPSNLGDQLLSLSNSRRMNEAIANDLMHWFPGEELDAVIANVNLKRKARIEVDKEGLYEFSIENNNPKLALDIAESHKKNISILNSEIGITSHKELITVLDPPKQPKRPYKPTLILNLVLGMFFSIILSLMTILSLEFLREYKNTESNV